MFEGLLASRNHLGLLSEDIDTATGERKRIPLADGGSLQLNTATAVDVDLAQRRISLVDGELALNVPGAAAMTVHTRYGQLLVGAADVCVWQKASGCLVSVLSGGAFIGTGATSTVSVLNNASGIIRGTGMLLGLNLTSVDGLGIAVNNAAAGTTSITPSNKIIMAKTGLLCAMLISSNWSTPLSIAPINAKPIAKPSPVNTGA